MDEKNQKVQINQDNDRLIRDTIVEKKKKKKNELDESTFVDQDTLEYFTE